MDEIKEWYAAKINKSVDEFDDVDVHICRVVFVWSKENKPKTKGFGIPYDAMSDGLKSSIDSIEAALSKRNKPKIK